ncbi:5997_t:CDS:1, partial [Ambispora leptoticha]
PSSRPSGERKENGLSFLASIVFQIVIQSSSAFIWGSDSAIF